MLIPSAAPGLVFGSSSLPDPLPSTRSELLGGQSEMAEPHGTTLQSSVSASWSCRRAESGRGPRDAPGSVPQERDGKAQRLGWLRPAEPILGAAFLHPLICITEPLFALINVSAKCLMCEMPFLLAGIGRAVWDSRLLHFQGQDSPDKPALVLLSFWLAVSKGLGLSSQACFSTQKPGMGEATVSPMGAPIPEVLLSKAGRTIC